MSYPGPSRPQSTSFPAQPANINPAFLAAFQPQSSFPANHQQHQMNLSSYPPMTLTPAQLLQQQQQAQGVRDSALPEGGVRDGATGGGGGGINPAALGINMSNMSGMGMNSNNNSNNNNISSTLKFNPNSHIPSHAQSSQDRIAHLQRLHHFPPAAAAQQQQQQAGGQQQPYSTSHTPQQQSMQHTFSAQAGFAQPSSSQQQPQGLLPGQSPQTGGVAGQGQTPGQTQGQGQGGAFQSTFHAQQPQPQPQIQLSHPASTSISPTAAIGTNASSQPSAGSGSAAFSFPPHQQAALQALLAQSGGGVRERERERGGERGAERERPSSAASSRSQSQSLSQAQQRPPSHLSQHQQQQHGLISLGGGGGGRREMNQSPRPLQGGDQSSSPPLHSHQNQNQNQHPSQGQGQGQHGGSLNLRDPHAYQAQLSQLHSAQQHQQQHASHQQQVHHQQQMQMHALMQGQQSHSQQAHSQQNQPGQHPQQNQHPQTQHQTMMPPPLRPPTAGSASGSVGGSAGGGGGSRPGTSHSHREREHAQGQGMGMGMGQERYAQHLQQQQQQQQLGHAQGQGHGHSHSFSGPGHSRDPRDPRDGRDARDQRDAYSTLGLGKPGGGGHGRSASASSLGVGVSQGAGGPQGQGGGVSPRITHAGVNAMGMNINPNMNMNMGMGMSMNINPNLNASLSNINPNVNISSLSGPHQQGQGQGQPPQGQPQGQGQAHSPTSASTAASARPGSAQSQSQSQSQSQGHAQTTMGAGMGMGRPGSAMSTSGGGGGGGRPGSALEMNVGGMGMGMNVGMNVGMGGAGGGGRPPSRPVTALEQQQGMAQGMGGQGQGQGQHGRGPGVMGMGAMGNMGGMGGQMRDYMMQMQARQGQGQGQGQVQGQMQGQGQGQNQGMTPGMGMGGAQGMGGQGMGGQSMTGMGGMGQGQAQVGHHLAQMQTQGQGHFSLSLGAGAGSSSSSSSMQLQPQQSMPHQQQQQMQAAMSMRDEMGMGMQHMRDQMGSGMQMHASQHGHPSQNQQGMGMGMQHPYPHSSPPPSGGGAGGTKRKMTDSPRMGSVGPSGGGAMGGVTGVINLGGMNAMNPGNMNAAGGLGVGLGLGAGGSIMGGAGGGMMPPPVIPGVGGVGPGGQPGGQQGRQQGQSPNMTIGLGGNVAMNTSSGASHMGGERERSVVNISNLSGTGGLGVGPGGGGQGVVNGMPNIHIGGIPSTNVGGGGALPGHTPNANSIGSLGMNNPNALGGMNLGTGASAALNPGLMNNFGNLSVNVARLTSGLGGAGGGAGGAGGSVSVNGVPPGPGVGGGMGAAQPVSSSSRPFIGREGQTKVDGAEGAGAGASQGATGPSGQPQAQVQGQQLPPHLASLNPTVSNVRLVPRAPTLVKKVEGEGATANGASEVAAGANVNASDSSANEDTAAVATTTSTDDIPTDAPEAASEGVSSIPTTVYTDTNTIPPLSSFDLDTLKEIMAQDNAYEELYRGMKSRMSAEAKNVRGAWWERDFVGTGVVGAAGVTRRRGEGGFDVRYPRAKGAPKERGRKPRREGFRIPSKLSPEDANRPEQLVPIRLEFDVEHHKMRDTFVWNLNDPIVTPEAFAQSIVDDYALAPSYHTTITKAIQDQLSDYKAHTTSFDGDANEVTEVTDGELGGDEKEREGTTVTRGGTVGSLNASGEENGNDAGNVVGRGCLDEEETQWWEAWRKRSRAVSLGRGDGSKKAKKRRKVGGEAAKSVDKNNEMQKDGEGEKENVEERPTDVDDLEWDERSMHEEMRILIKLDIIVGTMKLDDQFEWDLDNIEASPEQFAEVYAKELGLGGEFKTAIAHCIREQVQIYQKSLFLVGHPLDGSVVQDDDLRMSFLPSLNSGTRAIDQVQSFTPLLNYLSDGEIERSEREREKELTKRRKRNTRGRRGIALPDREPIRTYRTPGVGFPELDPATLALAAAANAPTSRRAAAAAASLTIANMVASENGTSIMPMPVQMSVQQTSTSAMSGMANGKEKKPKGLFKAPSYPSSVLRPRAQVTAPIQSTAVDASTLPPPPENDPPVSFASSASALPVDSRTARILAARRVKELEREAKEKEYADGQHANLIDGVWHCSNCGCPESIAIGRRKGPLGDKSQCGTCGKFWHRHRRPRPVEYNADAEYHINLRREVGTAATTRRRGRAQNTSLQNNNDRPDTPSRSRPEVEAPSMPPASSNALPSEDDRAVSPVSESSSGSEPPLAQQFLKANGGGHASPAPPPQASTSETPTRSPAPRPASTSNNSQGNRSPFPTEPSTVAGGTVDSSYTPPPWLSEAMHEMQSRYPEDKFEAILRKATSKTAPEWRLKCLDCPGKLYTPGPGETLSNYEVHLRNRQHRQRVNSRLGLSS